MKKQMDIYDKLVLIVGLVLGALLIAFAVLGVVKKLNNSNKNENTNRNVIINMKESNDDPIQGPSIKDPIDQAIFVTNFIYNATPYLSNEIDEEGYKKVLYERFNSFNDMDNYLKGIFSPELVNKYKTLYLDNNLFIEKDDNLYSKVPEDRKSPYDIEFTYVNDFISEDLTIYKIIVSECESNYEVKYEKQKDGSYLFTDFKNPYDICYNK